MAALGESRARRLPTQSLFFSLLALLATLCTACLGDTPQEEEAAVQGDYEDGDREHRPGQPCLLCHGPGHFPFPPGFKIFKLAGTVYPAVDSDENAGLEGIVVEVTDADGVTTEVTSNRVGNFMISSGGDSEEGGWRKTRNSMPFPWTVALSNGERRIEMRSKVWGEGSCARCHGEREDIDSVGRVFFGETL